MDLRPVESAERGRIGRVSSAEIVKVLHSIQQGSVYDLDAGRYPGMPQWDGHPRFMLTTFRSPRGSGVQADIPLLDAAGNTEGFRFVSELMVTGMHIGTHIDALCHVTRDGVGWHGGYSPDDYLGDFGALRSDAATIPPIIVTGVLLDVAGYRGIDRLPAGAGLGAQELREVEKVQGVPIPPGSAVFVRTGLMSVWTDPSLFNEGAGAGPNLEAAKWLVEERDIHLLGSDTPTVEQIPSASHSHPHPVHDYTLLQHGVHLLENLYLEELARDRCYQFALICLPLKINGATASMVRPVAVV